MIVLYKILVACLILFYNSKPTDCRKSENEILRGSRIVRVEQSKYGSVVPKPQFFQAYENQFYINPILFSFALSAESQTCDLIWLAFKRYYNIIFNPQNYEIISNEKKVTKLRKPDLDLHIKDEDQILTQLMVTVIQPCEKYPTLESDESCKFIKISF